MSDGFGHRLKDLFSDDDEEETYTEEAWEALHRDDPPDAEEPETERAHPLEMPDEKEGRWR